MICEIRKWCKSLTKAMYHLQFSLIPFFFFSIWVFFHDHSRITGLQRKGEGISLTPLYHSHPLHKHRDISRVITAESSPLHIVTRDSYREPLVSEHKSLTTKLRALVNYFLSFFG